MWATFALALTLASACGDSVAPPLIPPVDDSTGNDSNQQSGFLIRPMGEVQLWV